MGHKSTAKNVILAEQSINLSELGHFKSLSLDDVIDYLIDNKILFVVNDFAPHPQVEYSLSDLFLVWDNLKKLL